jgi:ArsR family transcriptional regulator, arsenate/arsenite/antimonite-responsive transcriptional repressor
MTKKETLAVTDLSNMAEVLKAMAHTERLAIAKLLSQSPEEKLTVKSIYEKLNLSQPIVSRHLNVMKSVGVVRRLQVGQKTYYCLCSEKKNVENLSKCL